MALDHGDIYLGITGRAEILNSQGKILSAGLLKLSYFRPGCFSSLRPLFLLRLRKINSSILKFLQILQAIIHFL